MKFRYTEEDDALLVQFSKEKIDDAVHSGDVIAHLDKKGSLVLLEILDASRFLQRITSKMPKETREFIAGA